MLNLHKRVICASVILFVLLFLYICLRNFVNNHDFLLAPIEHPVLVNTTQSVSAECNTSSGVHKELLLQLMPVRYFPVSFASIRPRNIDLTPDEQNNAVMCLHSAVSDRETAGSRYYGKEDHKRVTHHTYLKNKTDLVIIEIGGNIGVAADKFVKMYDPLYIILEPLEHYFKILKEKFKNSTRVTVVNVGLGVTDEVVMVNIEGHEGDATSKFSGVNGKTPLYITNATKFLMSLGIGLFDVDLFTMNCEGCEYEVLETILSTNIVSYIKNIQFDTHSTLNGLNDPLGRYCKIQELLRRTHKLTYQYKLLMENWRRHDLL